MAEVFWRTLAQRDPKDVAACCGARANADGSYDLPTPGGRLRLDPSARRFEFEAADGAADAPSLGLAALVYLARTGAASPSGEWISPCELPSGAAFFRGPHDVPAAAIAERFGRDVDSFRAACERLGGRPLPFGDAAYALDLFPRLPVAVLVWRADDEFPARAAMLVDRRIERSYPLDGVLAMLGAMQSLLVLADDRRPGRR